MNRKGCWTILILLLHSEPFEPSGGGASQRETTHVKKPFWAIRRNNCDSRPRDDVFFRGGGKGGTAPPLPASRSTKTTLPCWGWFSGGNGLLSQVLLCASCSDIRFSEVPRNEKESQPSNIAGRDGGVESRITIRKDLSLLLSTQSLFSNYRLSKMQHLFLVFFSSFSLLSHFSYRHFPVVFL